MGAKLQGTVHRTKVGVLSIPEVRWEVPASFRGYVRPNRCIRSSSILLRRSSIRELGTQLMQCNYVGMTCGSHCEVLGAMEGMGCESHVTVSINSRGPFCLCRNHSKSPAVWVHVLGPLIFGNSHSAQTCGTLASCPLEASKQHLDGSKHHHPGCPLTAWQT